MTLALALFLAGTLLTAVVAAALPSRPRAAVSSASGERHDEAVGERERGAE